MSGRAPYNPFNPYDPYDPYDPYSPYGPYNSYSLVNPYNPYTAHGTPDSRSPTQSIIEEERTLIGGTGYSRIGSLQEEWQNTDFGPEQKLAEKKPEAPAKDEFPDGGLRAWMVVAGVSFCDFATPGASTDVSGTRYYGGCQPICDGLIVGRLFDLGYFRIPQIAASIVLVGGTFLTAECKEYWQFLICQGVGVGVSSFADVLRLKLIPNIWHNRIWGKHRRNGDPYYSAQAHSAYRVSMGHESVRFSHTEAIRSHNFLTGLASLSCNGNTEANYKPIVLTYLEVYGREGVGIPKEFSIYLIPIANAASLVGRVGSGYVTDKVGPLNTLIPSTLVAGICTFIWPFARSKGALIAVSSVYGIACGTFVGMLPAPVAKMGSPEDVGRRTGMLMTIAATGALAGPPISGAILGKTDSFVAVGLYAGARPAYH
ncbi:MFS_1 domain-containing protein [Rhizoctonia solani AG-1 IA]|uniref:MFS_1 domain-containing protein n=1 Tax=Thanatephorus cucumeris (strain AG1-IA) TaxID=983506 RepID=L8X6B1_THACA|nr:MFS_1 domain-containing protein [Rhizoctonia solani AG-1 IA]